LSASRWITDSRVSWRSAAGPTVRRFRVTRIRDFVGEVATPQKFAKLGVPVAELVDVPADLRDADGRAAGLRDDEPAPVQAAGVQPGLVHQPADRGLVTDRGVVTAAIRVGMLLVVRPSYRRQWRVSL
jgi:hypothetical protein